MTLISYDDRRGFEALPAGALATHQLERLNSLLGAILPANPFYAEKLRGVKLPLAGLDDVAALPYTYKDELLEAQSSPRLHNRTYPLTQYVRYHQTSGTRGRPLVVLDTADDWSWWLDCWQFVFDAGRVTADDCVLLAFSFGPFIGFWSACDAAAARGALVVPTGGLSTIARLELLRRCQATVVCCTPSYALHMAEVAVEQKHDLSKSSVKTLILAGEPGGSIPSTRKCIEDAWQARVIDHAGATEVGPWGYGDAANRGLHVLESAFIAEFLSPASGKPASEGEISELVLTSLGRTGMPVLRYRTGDLVRPVWQHDLQCRFVLLEGGVLGRVDDMLIVRGVNVFPSAVEHIIRGFPEVLEYRIRLQKLGQMDHLLIEIEDRLNEPRRVADELHLRLGLRMEVTDVPLGSLPRFEGKGRRVVDER